MFKKADAGKPMVSLMEPKFILGVSEILTFGAEKYGKDNWKTQTLRLNSRRYNQASCCVSF